MVRIIYILLLSLLLSCATKHKTIDSVAREEHFRANTDSISAYVGGLNVQSEFSGFEVKDFAQALSFLNWNYSGGNADNFTVAIRQTADGYEASMFGFGSAEGGNTISQSLESQLLQLQSKYDSLEYKLSEVRTNIESIEILKERIKASEKKSTGFQAGFYITAGIAVIVMFFLLFLGWRMKLFR